MRYEKKFKVPGLTALAAVGALWLASVLPACNNQGCADNHNALPLMGFYALAADDEGKVAEQAIALDSVAIGGVGAPDDSLLVPVGQSVGSLYLPFRYNTRQTAFFFRYGYKAQGLDKPVFNDTLAFTYDAEPYFASEECGAMYRYRLRDVAYTRHLIDSVAVTDSMITNVERERIKVYFRVANFGEEPDNGILEIPDDPDRFGEIELSDGGSMTKGGGK